jgi:superfamily II DNA or RNA helicase
MVTLTIDNRVRLTTAELPEAVKVRLKEEFTHPNPKWAKLKALGYATFREPRQIKTWFERQGKAGELTLPRGALERVKQILVEELVEHRVVDAMLECEEKTYGGLRLTHAVQLYDYQERLVEQAIAAQTGIVRAPTGSGKTTAALALVARIARPTLVIVWDARLQDQWMQRIESETNLRVRDVGIIGGGRFTIRPLTVAMQQTLLKMNAAQWREVSSYFGVVVCDEVQRFAAKTFMQVIDHFPARWRIGVSADETRKDRLEFLLYDLFGRVVAEVQRDELIEQKFVHDVEVRVVPTDFAAPWYRDSEDADHQNFNRLLEEMAADAARNDLVVKLARTVSEQGEQVLIFSHRREHCVELSSQLTAHGERCGLLLGGSSDADEFRETVAKIKAGKQRVAVGTVQAIGQGLDLPSVSRGVLATPITSNRQLWGQLRGRLCRTAEGKANARIAVLWDRQVFGFVMLRNLCAWNRDVKVLSNGQWIEGRAFIESEAR